MPIWSPMPFGGMCHRTVLRLQTGAQRQQSPMPFGGMCHRTPARSVSRWLIAGHQCLSAGCVIGRAPLVCLKRGPLSHQCLSAGCVIGLWTSPESGRQRLLSHQCLSAGCVIGPVHPEDNDFDPESPMPFGGMCHRTRAWPILVPVDDLSPMPFGGMCHRTSSPTPTAGRPARSPMPFGGMCHRTRMNDDRQREVDIGHQCLSAGCVIGHGGPRGCSDLPLGHQCLSAGCVIGPSPAVWVPAWRPPVTNAFRRDVSSDSRISPEWVDSIRSPMPFGGMCHRTPSSLTLVVNSTRHQCLSAGCVIGPILSDGTAEERARHQCLSAGCVIGLQEEAADGTGAARHQCLSAGCVIGPPKRRRRRRKPWRSPMPFGGMCHRTPHKASARRFLVGSPMPFGGMCHRTWQSEYRLGGDGHGHQCLSAGCVIGRGDWRRTDDGPWVTNAFRRDVSSDCTIHKWRWVCKFESCFS